MAKKTLLGLIICISYLMVSCGSIPVYTDVDSNDELLQILSDSGKYVLSEEISIEDVFDDLETDGKHTSLDEGKETTKDHYKDEKSKDEKTENEEGTDTKYVLNTNSKKIHYPDCSSVPTIKEKNYDETNSREDAIAAGYVPCKRCNP